MPRHSPIKTKTTDEDRAHAFRDARARVVELADACEQAFDSALGATSEMLGLVASPEDAERQVDSTAELRRLVRRLQRRLDWP